MADAMREMAKAQDDLCAFYRACDSANIQRGSLPVQLLHHTAGGALNGRDCFRMTAFRHGYLRAAIEDDHARIGGALSLVW
jgi:hypothetical protein